jgi:hypothetical protein
MNISHAEIPAPQFDSSGSQIASGNSIGTPPAANTDNTGYAADLSPQANSNIPASADYAAAIPAPQFEAAPHSIGENPAQGISHAGQSGSFADTADLSPELFIAGMGYTEHAGILDFSNLKSGNGMVTGTEISAANPGGIEFGMYNAEQYMAPEGTHTIETAADGSKWYKQYAETPPNANIAQTQAKPKLPAIPLKKKNGVQVDGGKK